MSTFHIYVPGIEAPQRLHTINRGRAGQTVPERAKRMADLAVIVGGHDWAKVIEYKPRRVIYEVQKPT